MAIQYELVSSPKLTEFVREVNYLVNKGYYPLGEIVVTSHKEASNERAVLVYTQALYLHDESGE